MNYTSEMPYAIFFSSGLGLGFALGIGAWALSTWLAKKMVESTYREKLVEQTMALKKRQAEINEAVAKLRASYPDMSQRQTEIAEKELESVFQSRPRA